MKDKKEKERMDEIMNGLDGEKPKKANPRLKEEKEEMSSEIEAAVEEPKGKRGGLFQEKGLHIFISMGKKK